VPETRFPPYCFTELVTLPPFLGESVSIRNFLRSHLRRYLVGPNISLSNFNSRQLRQGHKSGNSRNGHITVLRNVMFGQIRSKTWKCLLLLRSKACIIPLGFEIAEILNIQNKRLSFSYDYESGLLFGGKSINFKCLRIKSSRIMTLIF
jgi:hypothetical protein